MVEIYYHGINPHFLVRVPIVVCENCYKMSSYATDGVQLNGSVFVPAGRSYSSW